MAETTSDYLKISRALDGDDWWGARLSIALELHGMEDSRANRLAITSAVVASISVNEAGAVVTSAVTDTQIDTAITALGAGA
jgi:hypothetical protein